jgi:epoxide hydrolase-like predicted phosphatase
VAISAVVFDIGGVLERVGDPELVIAPKWRERLGLSADGFTAAIRSVDPDRHNQVGAMSEAEYRERTAAALGLSADQADEFMADLWDWYRGELDPELHAFARSLRPSVRAAILSNSGDGARREEQTRYGFTHDFDPIIYSHEVGLAKPDPAIFELTCELLGATPAELVFIDDVPANIDAAMRFGLHAILHTTTASTIEAVRALLAELP